MAERHVDITIHVDEFKKDLEHLMKGRYPDVTARALGKVAKDARDAAREATKAKYNLHSNYIPNGIKSIPSTHPQYESAANSMRSHGDMSAAVFVRGSMTPERSLDFMVDHETGATRTPHGGGKMIATPATGVKRLSYRTGKGRVKAKYKPAKLLADYARKGPNVKGSDIAQQTKNTESNFFIMKRGDTVMIAKRNTLLRKPLGFYYFLNKSTRVKKSWGFEDTIRSTVRSTYRRTFERYFNRMIRQ